MGHWISRSLGPLSASSSLKYLSHLLCSYLPSFQNLSWLYTAYQTWLLGVTGDLHSLHPCICHRMLVTPPVALWFPVTLTQSQRRPAWWQGWAPGAPQTHSVGAAALAYLSLLIVYVQGCCAVMATAGQRSSHLGLAGSKGRQKPGSSVPATEPWCGLGRP